MPFFFALKNKKINSIQLTNFFTIDNMELKKEFLKGGTVYHKAVGHVAIVNDPEQFAKYKKLDLDVFKAEKKKKEKKDSE